MARDPSGADTGDTQDLDAVADRLEAALDRIVQRLGTPELGTPGLGTPGQGHPTVQLAARLDGLIERLRDALNPQN
jgi:hypothetical protein